MVLGSHFMLELLGPFEPDARFVLLEGTLEALRGIRLGFVLGRPDKSRPHSRLG